MQILLAMRIVTVFGPGLVTWDASLFKNNYIKKISDSFNMQFQAELFNILNHPIFATSFDNKTPFKQAGQPVGGTGAYDIDNGP